MPQKPGSKRGENTVILLPAILAMYATQAEKDQVTALFEAHHLAMYHMAMTILSSHEDAEDAVQEAFIVIHDHLEKLEDIYSQYARGFLMLTAKYISLNKIRGTSKNPVLKNIAPCVSRLCGLKKRKSRGF